MDIDKKVKRVAKDVGKTKDVFEDGDIIRFEKGYKKVRNASVRGRGYSIEDLRAMREVFVENVENVETVKYYTFAAIRAGGNWYVTGFTAGADKISYKELVENYLSDELTRNIEIASDFVAVEA